MSQEKIEQALSFLGKEVGDKLTDHTGIATSVSFDLMGCIQIMCVPKELDKDGKVQSGYWFDTNRLRVINEERVMPLPTWDYVEMPDEKRVVPTTNDSHGAAEKSSLGKR